MDILMICDSIGWRFTMQNCDTKVIDSHVGLMELTQLIYPGSKRLLGHDLSKYRILILMMGRADLIIPTVRFKTRWNFFMQEIRQNYPDLIVLVTPALSHPDDSDIQKATADYRSVFLSYYAHDHVKVEFCRPAKDMWSDVCPNQHYHDEHGCLTELAVAEIRANLREKITVHGLLHT